MPGVARLLVAFRSLLDTLVDPVREIGGVPDDLLDLIISRWLLEVRRELQRPRRVLYLISGYGLGKQLIQVLVRLVVVWIRLAFIHLYLVINIELLYFISNFVRNNIKRSFIELITILSTFKKSNQI